MLLLTASSHHSSSFSSFFACTAVFSAEGGAAATSWAKKKKTLFPTLPRACDRGALIPFDEPAFPAVLAVALSTRRAPRHMERTANEGGKGLYCKLHSSSIKLSFATVSVHIHAKSSSWSLEPRGERRGCSVSSSLRSNSRLFVGVPRVGRRLRTTCTLVLAVLGGGLGVFFVAVAAVCTRCT